MHEAGRKLPYIYIRPFSSIELACAVRQPSPCVRALCETCVLFHMSHLKLHFALHTSHFTVHTSHFSLLTAFFTSHSTLYTALFTPRTSHCTLHTPHFISSELFSPYPSSPLLYVIKAFMNHFPALLLRNLHALCGSQARARVLCAKLLQCCCPRR